MLTFGTSKPNPLESARESAFSFGNNTKGSTFAGNRENF